MSYQTGRPRRRRMLLAVALGVIAASATAQAGSNYLEQVVKTDGMMGQPPTEVTQKIWIGEGLYCIQDEANGIVTVFEKSTGKLVLIQTKEQRYSETSKEQLQGMAKMGVEMLKQMGQGGETAATARKTGNTAKIGEWNAYEVVAEISGAIPMKITIWFSKDLGIDQQVWSELADIVQANAMFGDITEQLSSYEGYPVKQTVEMSMMGMKIASTTQVTVAGSRPVDKKVCTVPAGFEKVEGLMALPQGGPPR